MADGESCTDNVMPIYTVGIPPLPPPPLLSIDTREAYSFVASLFFVSVRDVYRMVVKKKVQYVQRKAHRVVSNGVSIPSAFNPDVRLRGSRRQCVSTFQILLAG